MSDDFSPIMYIQSSTQLALFQAQDITRPDVNIGKWAGWIFASPWSKNLYENKKFSWVTKFQDEEVEASIFIRPINGQKRPTTTTYRVFLALIQIWEQSEKPKTGEIYFSARQLASMLDLKWCGKSTAKSLHDQLDILSNTSISWSFSFSKKGEVEKIYQDMHLLDGHTYFEKSSFLRKELFTRQQKVTLNKDIVANMLNGNTKPINYKTFISIKNDNCANLYMLLDMFLSKKNYWERRAYELLIEDLGYYGKRYEKRNIRLARLKELKKELQGKKISNGILDVSILETADKTDYKLVVKKLSLRKKRIPKEPANPKAEIPKIVDMLCETLVLAGANNLEKSRKTLEELAYWYPAEMLFSIASMVKVDFQGKIKKTVISTFMYLVHKEAHIRGKEWIKDCGKNCRYRPENQEELKQPFVQQPPHKKEAPKKKNVKAVPASPPTQKKYTSPAHAFSPKKITQQITQGEASTQVKKDFINTLSKAEIALLVARMQEDYPQIADNLADIWGTISQALLSNYIPDFEKKVEAVMDQEK